MSKGIKRIIREILFRPICIIFMPVSLLVYFLTWLLSSDESWNNSELNNLSFEESIWWKL